MALKHIIHIFSLLLYNSLSGLKNSDSGTLEKSFHQTVVESLNLLYSHLSVSFPFFFFFETFFEISLRSPLEL